MGCGKPQCRFDEAQKSVQLGLPEVDFLDYSSLTATRAHLYWELQKLDKHHECAVDDPQFRFKLRESGLESGSLGELQLKLRGWGADQSVVEMGLSGELSMTMPLSVLQAPQQTLF